MRTKIYFTVKYNEKSSRDDIVYFDPDFTEKNKSVKRVPVFSFEESQNTDELVENLKGKAEFQKRMCDTFGTICRVGYIKSDKGISRNDAKILMNYGVYCSVFDIDDTTLPFVFFFDSDDNSRQIVASARRESIDELKEKCIDSEIPALKIVDENEIEQLKEKYSAEFSSGEFKFSDPVEFFDILVERFVDLPTIADDIHSTARFEMKTIDSRCNIKEISNGTLRSTKDNAIVLADKYCLDNSGDIIMFVGETKGEEGVATFINDTDDLGFKFMIYPSEIKTFRIDADGFVRELNFLEGTTPHDEADIRFDQNVYF